MKKIYLLLFFSLSCSTLFAQFGCTTLVQEQFPQSRCGSGNFTFTITDSQAGGGIIFADYQWFVFEASGWVQLGTTNNAYTTPSLSATKYYRATANQGFGCEVQEFYFTALITPPLAAPVPIHANVCGYGGATAKVQYLSGYTYDWYDGVTGEELEKSMAIAELSTGHIYNIGGPGYSEITVQGVDRNLSFTVIARSSSGGSCGTGSPTTVEIRHYQLPTVSAGADQPVCISAGTVSLSGSPSGGTWSGAGVSGNSFNPISTGAGSFTLTYSYTNPSTGCSASDSKVMIVGPAVVASPMQSCNTNIAYTLYAIPAGGTWSGSYVNSSTGKFNAYQAGAGTHAVAYTYTASGCTVVKNTTVTINNDTPWAFPYNTPISSTACEGGSVTLQVAELIGEGGGILIPGDGISTIAWYDQNDNPVLVGGVPATGPQVSVTSNQVYYARAIHNDGCTSLRSAGITPGFILRPAAPQVINGINCAMGEGVVRVSPVDNSLMYDWYDSNGNYIDPMVIIGGGPFTYQVTGNRNSELRISGISNGTNAWVSVRARTISGTCTSYSETSGVVEFRTPPTVSAGADQPVCISAGSVSLSGSPSGGTWSGTGVSGNSFNPLSTGSGSFTLVYSYTDLSTGCSASDSKVMTVGPAVVASPMQSCNTNIAYPLYATPSGGTWSGNFVNSSTGKFNAYQAGAGTHAITYTYSASGCTVVQNTTVTINNDTPWAFPYDTPTPSNTACEGGTITLQVAELIGEGGGILIPGGGVSTIAWYDQNDNPVLVGGVPATGPQVSVTSNQVYYARAIHNDGCTSLRSAGITPGFILHPAAPQVINGVNCAMGEGVVKVSPVDNSLMYDWYDSNGAYIDPMVIIGGGTLQYQVTGNRNSELHVSGIPNGENVLVSVRARTLSGACTSYSETFATVEFKTPPSEIIAPDLVKCGPGTVMLTASGANLINFDWSRSTAPFVVWKNGSTVESDHLTASSAYSVTGYDANGCSISDNVTVTYSDFPSPPQVATAEFCSFEYATLKAQTDGATSANWYAVNESTLLHSGLELTLDPFYETGTFTYEVESVNFLGCQSTKVQAVIQIPDDCDHRINWIKSTTFDETGTNEISSSKAYFDERGQLLQSQSKMYTTNTTFASQSLRDRYDRVVGSTLSAPIAATDFRYNPLFNRNMSGHPYGASDFDNPETNTILNPIPVANDTPGSLGWYYSANNSLEQNVPITSYPYSRTEFYEDGTGEVKRSASAGDYHRLGVGNENWSGTFPLMNELQSYTAYIGEVRREVEQVAWKNKALVTTYDGTVTSTSTNSWGPGAVSSQFLHENENGKIEATITENVGNKMLGLAPIETRNYLQMPYTAYCNGGSLRAYSNGTSLQIITSLAVGDRVALQRTDGQVRILKNDVPVYTFPTANTGVLYAGVNIFREGELGSVTWQWKDRSPVAPIEGIQQVVRDENGLFAVSITDKAGRGLMSGKFATEGNKVVTISNSATCAVEGERKQLHFYLTHPQTISIANAQTNFELVNTITNEVITNVSQQLPIGFYKLTATVGDPVTITYVSYLKDISYSYYDNVGRLKASVSPNGVQALQNGSVFAEIDKTTYTYNHRGWLLEMTEPDAGTTRYQYRKDGKIRFSQNAEQRLNNWFSYTHYDKQGRPVESGEYRGTAYTFMTLSAQLEYVNQINFSEPETRDWVKTHYDEVAADFTAEIGTIADDYQQEFVRNAVSWTENQDSRTWYSYDEFGRVAWMLQRPLGMHPRVFATTYAYDFLGNVLTTATHSYTLGGIRSDSFYHHYTYDADQRLTEVSTSVDGEHKQVQASYSYYLHGPLKRIELGETIQGIDFTYNINGWLTGINVDKNNTDPGRDGETGEHNGFKKDAFKLALDYYEFRAQPTELELSLITPQQFHRVPTVDENGLVNFVPKPAYAKASADRPAFVSTSADRPAYTENKTKATTYLDALSIPGLQNASHALQEESEADDLLALAYSEDVEEAVISYDYEEMTEVKLSENMVASLDASTMYLVDEGLVPDSIEYSVLKEFFESLGGTNWSNKTNWPTEVWPALVTNDVYKNWYGVTVANGDIIRISHVANNLVGTIPINIYKLQQITELTLRNNPGLTGTLPASLGTMQKLVTATLYSNSLTGTLSPEIFNAPLLRVFNISYNNLTGTIPSEIGNGVNLTDLVLAKNQFTGQIPASVGNLTEMVNLYFWGNQLTGSIPSEIGQLTKLKYLRVDENQLSGSIPISIGNLTNLETGLFLNNNKLAGTIPSVLGNLEKLLTLKLENNLLSGSIPPEIGNLPNLTTLHLQRNQFSGQIPPSLGDLKKLKSLYLEYNLFSGAIPPELGSMVDLEYLYIRYNDLTGTLPNELGQLIKLKQFIAEGNELTGTIPQSFKNLSNLTYFYIQANKFSGVLDPTIFEGWANLQYLYLNSNNFEGAFPTSIDAMTNLIICQVQNTKFTSFPSSLAAHTKLTSLALNGNQLKTIPDFTLNPNKANLTIDLRYNHLEPDDLEKLYAANGTHAFKFLYTTPQNPQPQALELLPAGTSLTLSATDTSPTSTINWQKLVSGATWNDVSALNESGNQHTFLIASPTSVNTGKYRAKITNTKFPTITFYGTIHEVIATDALPTQQPHALYNGLISAARWVTDKAYGSTEANHKGMYQYAYDDKYQIKDASWNNVSGDLALYQTAGNKYRLTGMDYDANGNIKTLKRYTQAGAYQHNFAYQYKANTNQLQAIPGYTTTYAYNSIGQLTLEDRTTGDDDDKFIVYDVSGKVVRVYKRGAAPAPGGGGPGGGAPPDPGMPYPGQDEDIVPDGYTIAFYYLYNDRGFRLAKVDVPNTTSTWYIRDASGNILSIYEEKNGNLYLSEVPVYGSGKIGSYYPLPSESDEANDKPTGSMAYELTDHLGNVRAIVKKQVTEYVATMEDNGQVDLTNPRVQEMQAFDNLFETGVRDVRFNHTKLPNAEWSAYLHWVDGMAGMQAADKAVGPAIALKVDAGDTLSMETWARFKRKASFNRDLTLGLFASFLGGSFAYAPGFEGSLPAQVADELDDLLAAGGLFNDNDDTRPYAYLNYILFDEQMNVVDQDWMRVSDDAGFWPGEEGLPNRHKKVSFGDPIITTTKGYLYVWVSNLSEDAEVWFDDVKVRHVQTIVSQATDYGVWGEVLREQKANSLEQYRYQYQGQFAEKDEETGWNHFELREYDGVIGRWTAVDPKRVDFSPYVGMGNNPITSTDPDGGSPLDIIRRVNGVEVERTITPDDFDIVINEYTFPAGSLFVDFVSIGIFDKIFYSGFQLTPQEFQLRFDKYFPKATGEIDFDAGGQLMIGEIAAVGFKGIGAGISAVRGLTQRTAAEGSYLVYEGIGKEGVRYIGITSRDIAERAMEHMADPLKAGLRFVPIKGLENLSKQAARVAEQRLINYYGLQKNGGVLLNRINSIAPSKWSLNGIK